MRVVLLLCGLDTSAVYLSDSRFTFTIYQLSAYLGVDFNSDCIVTFKESAKHVGLIVAWITINQPHLYPFLSLLPLAGGRERILWWRSEVGDLLILILLTLILLTHHSFHFRSGRGECERRHRSAGNHQSVVWRVHSARLRWSKQRRLKPVKWKK